MWWTPANNIINISTAIHHIVHNNNSNHCIRYCTVFLLHSAHRFNLLLFFISFPRCAKQRIWFTLHAVLPHSQKLSAHHTSRNLLYWMSRAGYRNKIIIHPTLYARVFVLSWLSIWYAAVQFLCSADVDERRACGGPKRSLASMVWRFSIIRNKYWWMRQNKKKMYLQLNLHI